MYIYLKIFSIIKYVKRTTSYYSCSPMLDFLNLNEAVDLKITQKK